MKQIRINIPLTVTHKTQDTVAEPVWLGSLLTRGRLFVRQTIYAMAGSVHVTIVGDQRAVQDMLTKQKNDPAVLIQRALSALGYVVGDHKKDAEQFSQWVDHLATFPRSEEALTLWTSAMLARLSSAEPPMIAETVDEASNAAVRVVVKRMRLFPPAPKTGLDDGPPITWDRVKIVGMDLGTEAWAEFQEWRTTAKQRGWDTPLAMRGHLASDDAELIAWRSAGALHNCKEPRHLTELAAYDYAQFAELIEWRKAGAACGIRSSAELASMKDANFGQFVDKKIVAEWRDATDCLTPAQAKSKIEGLSFAKEHAEQAEQRERAWCDATGKLCPGDAEQRIEDLQMQVKMQSETIRQWQAATERQTPELAKAHISQLENRTAGLLRDIAAWQKATGASDPDAAIARGRADLDAWQDATGTMNLHAAYKRIHELEAKLLSYASEIDALRKAAQSTKQDPVVVDIEHGAHFALNGQTIGRVYDPERELAKVRAELQSKCREAQTEKERANTAEGMYQAERAKRESEVRVEKQRGDSEFKRRVNLETWFNGVREALGNNSIAFGNISDHVADLRKSERENDATIDKLRVIFYARKGEDVIDAAKRAIVPLPKPEKVEAGQKWARVARITSVGSWGVIERATMGSEQPTLTSLRNDNDWTYLGT